MGATVDNKADHWAAAESRGEELTSAQVLFKIVILDLERVNPGVESVLPLSIVEWRCLFGDLDKLVGLLATELK